MAVPIVETGDSGRPTLPWTRPTQVGIDSTRGRVVATYPTLDRDDKPHGGGALKRFLSIAAAKSDDTRQKRIRDFVHRYGLLRSPFSQIEQSSPDYEGLNSIYEERLRDYVELSDLLHSALVLHQAIHGGRKLPAADVVKVMDFVDRHALVSLSLHRIRGVSGDAWHSLRTRAESPLAHEFPAQGDLRGLWRALQGERVVELFNLWISKGRVSPILVWEGKNLRGDQWTGAAWGALAGELQGALTGRSRFGVCAFCNRAYEGKYKRPRETYAEKPVSLCCGEADCLRAKRREQTARSRAKSRRTTRARARTRVLVS